MVEILDEEIIVDNGIEEMEKISGRPTVVLGRIEVEMDKERLREIDAAAELLGLPNFSENITKMSELIEQLISTSKDQASQRRAQFATSGSVEIRPKKSARGSFK